MEIQKWRPSKTTVRKIVRKNKHTWVFEYFGVECLSILVLSVWIFWCWVFEYLELSVLKLSVKCFSASKLSFLSASKLYVLVFFRWNSTKLGVAGLDILAGHFFPFNCLIDQIKDTSGTKLGPLPLNFFFFTSSKLFCELKSWLRT